MPNVRHAALFEHARQVARDVVGALAELGEAPERSAHYQVLFIIGILLFSITFMINLIADLVVKGIRGK